MSNRNKNTPIRIGDRVRIYQRGKRGLFVASFHHQGHRVISLRTNNLKDAINQAKLIDAKLINGVYVPPNRKPCNEGEVTIENAAASFMQYLTHEKKRKKTLDGYRGMLNKFEAFSKERNLTRLADVTIRHYDEYRARRSEEIERRTLFNNCRFLKRFFRWCRERGFIASDPLVSIKLKKPKSRKGKAPELDVVNAVIAHTSGAQAALFALLAFTGARIGEARNLLVEDVDLRGGWIHVRSRPGFETKNGEDRLVPMHPRLMKILKALSWPRSGWFFRGPACWQYPRGDHHINPRKVNDMFKDILEQLGKPAGRDGGYTLHSLRRFFETESINAGVPERVSGLWIGHSDRKDVTALYFDLRDEDSQAFMRKIPFHEGKDSEDPKCG